LEGEVNFFFLILNFFLYFSSLLLIYYKKNLSFIDKLIGAFILYLFILISSFPILGYFHILEFKTILSYTIFFITLFTILSFKNIKPLINEIKFYFFELINFLKQKFYFSIIIFFIILEIFLIIRYLILNGIDGWDTFMYHIQISSRIVIEKGMPSFEFLNNYLPHFFFPKNVEFLFSYFYIFNKSIDCAPLFHIIFVFFGVLSVYSILRKLNIKRERALFSFLLFFLPILPHQSVTGYCDLEFNMLFII